MEALNSARQKRFFTKFWEKFEWESYQGPKVGWEGGASMDNKLGGLIIERKVGERVESYHGEKTRR